jgi:hypothetical protein
LNPTKSVTANYLNDVHIRLVIKNTSASTIKVKVRRTVLSGPSEHMSYFCWSECYDPSVSESPTSEAIAAGVSSNIFVGSLAFDRKLRDKNVGVSVVRYCFFNEANPSDSICIDLTYNIIKSPSIVLVNPQLSQTLTYDEEGEVKIPIENFSSSPVTVKTTMKKVSGPASHLPYMCFTVCYTPEVFESPDTETLKPGEVNNKFLGHLNVATKGDAGVGVSVVRFCFVNVDNSSDSVCADVVFEVTKATGIEDGNLGVAGVKVSPAFPNPTSDFINLNYTLPFQVERAYIEISNILGKTVRIEPLDPFKQSLKLDVTNFKPGIYLYRILVNGKRSAAKRFLVR